MIRVTLWPDTGVLRRCPAGRTALAGTPPKIASFRAQPCVKDQSVCVLIDRAWQAQKTAAPSRGSRHERENGLVIGRSR
jgi:hypothetical protein